jgi:hypothetical protein
VRVGAPLAAAGISSARSPSTSVARCRSPTPGRPVRVYVGTGGPAISTPLNDGSDPRAGCRRGSGWEAPLFRCSMRSPSATTPRSSPCATRSGLMCRWLHVADPVARGPEKGGKSEGVLDNLLTEPRASTRCFARSLGGSARGPAPRPRQPALRPDPHGRRATARGDHGDRDAWASTALPETR